MAAGAIDLGAALWPLLVILIAGYAATDLWRVLGVVAAARVDESSEALRWVRAVSTALVAGLVARLIVFPIGAMAAAPLSVRLGGVAVGVAVYFAFGRHVLAGILAGETVLIIATIIIRQGL